MTFIACSLTFTVAAAYLTLTLTYVVPLQVHVFCPHMEDKS